MFLFYSTAIGCVPSLKLEPDEYHEVSGFALMEGVEPCRVSIAPLLKEDLVPSTPSKKRVNSGSSDMDASPKKRHKHLSGGSHISEQK